MAAVKLAPSRSGYHSRSSVDWRRAENLVGKAIGVELEVEAHDNYAELLDSLPEHDHDVDGPAPHFEADGSLDSHRGVEIIFPPYSPQSIRDGSAYLMKAAKGLDDSGRLNISTRCGMHMNVNAYGWSAHKRAVFVGIIHNMPRPVLEELGGRPLNHYCMQSPNPRLRAYATSPGDSHDYAVEHKHGGTRLELRFPAATVDLEHISLLATFIDYLDDYADAMPENWNVTTVAHYANFIKALSESPNGEANALATFLTT